MPKIAQKGPKIFNKTQTMSLTLSLTGTGSLTLSLYHSLCHPLGCSHIQSFTLSLFHSLGHSLSYFATHSVSDDPQLSSDHASSVIANGLPHAVVNLQLSSKNSQQIDVVSNYFRGLISQPSFTISTIKHFNTFPPNSTGQMRPGELYPQLM